MDSEGSTELSPNSLSLGEHSENGSKDSSKQNPEKHLLIPGIPDDIAFSFLVRIPRKYHGILNCVSKRWRELVSSDEWYVHRRKHHMEETWVYALCRDKFGQLSCYVLDPDQLKRGWKRISDPPSRCLKRKGIGFEVSKRKLYLVGGCDWAEYATDEVYCYDTARNVWNEAPSLSIPRCYFACEAINDKIYAIGGIEPRSSNPQSWDTFDPETCSWTSHADLNVIPDIEDSFVLDGLIYIRTGSSFVSSHVYAVVYNPACGTWQHADHDMVSGWRGPAIVVDGHLYVLDQTSGIRLMLWKEDKREWMAVRRFSSLLTKPPCRLVAIGKKLFVIGKGLGTVMFDVENLGNLDGVLMASSAPKLITDDDLVHCKSVAI
ncbi:hypothetical protein Leryth_020697 [Lithospermum erythrorhizon]|nr:hypothetical protein Leryth_020697 [Lithospermum erythrorhizon]